MVWSHFRIKKIIIITSTIRLCVCTHVVKDLKGHSPNCLRGVNNSKVDKKKNESKNKDVVK